MPALLHSYGTDLFVNEDGKLAIMDGETEVVQNLIKRLMTISDGMLLHPKYGAGLGEKIGLSYNQGELTDLISNQLLLQEGIDTSKPYSVVINPLQGSIYKYTVYLSFTVKGYAAPTTLTFPRVTAE